MRVQIYKNSKYWYFGVKFRSRRFSRSLSRLGGSVLEFNPSKGWLLRDEGANLQKIEILTFWLEIFKFCIFEWKMYWFLWNFVGKFIFLENFFRKIFFFGKNFLLENFFFWKIFFLKNFFLENFFFWKIFLGKFFFLENFFFWKFFFLEKFFFGIFFFLGKFFFFRKIFFFFSWRNWKNFFDFFHGEIKKILFWWKIFYF